MRLLDVRVERRAADVRLVGVVEPAGRPAVEVYFSYPLEFADFVSPGAEPFVPALLIPCLTRGEPLSFQPPVGPALLENVPEVQDMLLSWFPEFRRVEFEAPAAPVAATPPATNVGAFFSGGVDSFYTLLKSLRGHRRDGLRITHLVFMRGQEQPLGKLRGVEAAQSHATEVAAEAGVTLIAGETNLRDHFNPNYERYYHGSALCAVALSLSGGLGTMLVPSGFSLGQMQPWGSHPMLDPLWSTERLRILHDGGEARRVDKVERLVGRDPLALRHLRVCLDNAGGGTNCGRCHKCLRTMLSLAFVGVLGDSAAFPPRIPSDFPRLVSSDVPKLLDEIIELAERTGREPELLTSLRAATQRLRRRSALRAALEATPSLSWMIPAWRRVRRGLRGGAARA